MDTALRSRTIAEDPRVTRTRQAVIDTAIDLLIESGPAGITIDAIVARSGVAKSTIYRHWDTRDDVLVDVIASCQPSLPDLPADLPVPEALRRMLYSVVEMTTDPATARVLSTLILLREELHGIEAVADRQDAKQELVLTSILDRGVAEGLLRPGYDVHQAAASLIGPLIFAFLTRSLPTDRALADRTVDAFLAAESPNRRPAG